MIVDRAWLEKRTKTNPDGCMCWQLGRDRHGYGQVSKVVYGESLAHRVVYKNLVGAIPAGYMVLHSCDNPFCCNPEHLSVGLQTENMRQAVERKRFVGRQRIRPEDVIAFRKTVKTQKEVAEHFGVSKGYICEILNGNKGTFYGTP